MKTCHIAIFLAVSTPTACPLAGAQSPTFSDTHSAGYVNAVTEGGPAYHPCDQPRYTQYVRPHSAFSYSDYVNTNPCGPCCRTIFGELVCDLKYHFNRVIHCGDDVLATTSGHYCCDFGCDDPLDCVPRLRDLVPSGMLLNLLSPAWCCGGCSTYEIGGHSLGCSVITSDDSGLIEGDPSRETAPTPAAKPGAEGGAPNLPDAPSMPAPSARLRAVTAPPWLAQPYWRVQRSQFTQPVTNLRGAISNQSASLPPAPQRLPTLQAPRLEAPKVTSPAPPAATAPSGGPSTVGTIQGQSQASPPATIPAIHFGDRFGKWPRSGLRGATFR